MPMTAIEAQRAMEWARAKGHSAEEAIDLVEYITKTQRPEKKEEEQVTKE